MTFLAVFVCLPLGFLSGWGLRSWLTPRNVRKPIWRG